MGLKWIFASSFCGILLAISQLHLSKREEKWPGLVLPAAFLCLGAFLAFDSWKIISEFPSTIIGPVLIGGIPACLFMMIYMKVRKKFCTRD